MSELRSPRTNWPHDAPSATELIDAVRGHLLAEATSDASGRKRWMARVASNALAVALRELESGLDDASEHALRLGRLGVADEATLSHRVRDGEFDDRSRELARELWEVTLVKLCVANPDYRDEALEPLDESS